MSKKAKAQNPKEIARAELTLRHTKSSVENFYTSFDSVRKARKATGAPTDGEQDLLRAAVVFAAGGLDITVKELIRGALKTLASKRANVQAEFEKFTRRQLKAEADVTGKPDPSKFLAEILVSVDPFTTLLEKYIYDLTGSSLQSVDELYKAASALDITHDFLRSNNEKLVTAFKVRNSIIHELDVTFSGKQGHRQRKSQTKAGLKKHSDLLIQVADRFVQEVKKLV